VNMCSSVVLSIVMKNTSHYSATKTPVVEKQLDFAKL